MERNGSVFERREMGREEARGRGFRWEETGPTNCLVGLAAYSLIILGILGGGGEDSPKWPTNCLVGLAAYSFIRPTVWLVGPFSREMGRDPALPGR